MLHDYFQFHSTIFHSSSFSFHLDEAAGSIYNRTTHADDILTLTSLSISLKEGSV